MFRINEQHVFLSAIIAALIIFAIQSFEIGILKDLQTIAGSYLLLIPVGYLFISVLMPLSNLNLSERLLLSIALSISIISIALLVLFFLFGLPLNFVNNVLAITVLCVLLFTIFLIELKFRFRIKPPEMKI